MTKNLIKEMMTKSSKSKSQESEESIVIEDDKFNAKAFIETIENGYLADRGPKFEKKYKFSPSKIAYGFGKCPRYWYLAFEGGTTEDTSKPYDVANMMNGTMGHSRVLETALKKSGIAIDVEFKIDYDSPPIHGYCDGLANWKDEDYVIELKTCNNEVFEYRKRTGKAKLGHIEQLLMYMKILNKGCGVVLYENKNTHELLAIPVYANDHYKKWVEGLFEWLHKTRNAWEEKTMPMKPYRSNSKVCKNCPFFSECSKAEAGVIKIEPLEELSEAM